MKPVYFVLLPDGEREGPYDEEELLDLMDAGEFGRQTVVEEERSRKRSKLGDLFQVIADPAAPKPGAAGGRTAPAAAQEEEGDDAGEDDEELEDEKDDADEAADEERDADLLQEKRPWQPAALPGFTSAGTAKAPGRPSAAPPSAEREPPDHMPLRILYAGSPSILNYWRGLTLCAALIAGGWFGGRYDPGYVIGGLVLGTVLLLGILARRSSVDYIVSTRRVELREGLVSQSSREIRIQDIRSINVDKPGLLGLFGVGDVEFSSSAAEGSDIQFRGVWRAARLRQLVRRLQDRGV